MANKTYIGTGEITESDFKAVKYTGKTKGGKPIVIEFEKAINLGNIDWTFAEKNEVVPEITFTAVYQNTDSQPQTKQENWKVTCDDSLTAGASSIILGVGIFSIGGVDVALTRGGGKFTVEREFREIAADGDRGPVEGRITMDGSRATLTMNMLEFISSMASVYPAVGVEGNPAPQVEE